MVLVPFGGACHAPLSGRKNSEGTFLVRLIWRSGDPAELLSEKQMGHFLVRGGFAAGCRDQPRHGALQALHGRRVEQESDPRAADTAMGSSRN